MRTGVIAAVMERFEQYYEQFVQQEDLSGIREAYEACLVNRDRDVRVLDPAGAYEAHAKGINDTGELIVVLPDGTEREIYAGEVSVRGYMDFQALLLQSSCLTFPVLLINNMKSF